MLTDFTAIIQTTIQSISVFLSTPPVSYIMALLMISIIIGIYLKVVRM